MFLCRFVLEKYDTILKIHCYYHCGYFACLNLEMV